MSRHLPFFALIALFAICASAQAQTNQIGFRRAAPAANGMPPIVSAGSESLISPTTTGVASPLQANYGGGNGGGHRSNNGMYVSMFGGYLDQGEYINSFDIALPPIITGSLDVTLNTSPGWALGGAMGRRFDNGFRLESEFVYRNSSLDTISATAFPGGPLGALPVTGNVNSYSSMFNLAYDFNRHASIRPYVGAGAGAAFHEFSFNAAPATISIDLPTVAFQYFAGVSMDVSHRAEAFLEYRAFGTQEFELNVTAPGANFNSEFDSLNHSIFAGLRLNLR